MDPSPRGGIGGGGGYFAYEMVGMFVRDLTLNPWRGLGFFDPQQRPYLKQVKYLLIFLRVETVNETIMATCGLHMVGFSPDHPK